MCPDFDSARCAFRLKEQDIDVTGGSNSTPDSSAAGVLIDHPARTLLLRDGVVFFVLLASTLALYGVTSLLFRSFAVRRQQLAMQFSASGRQALRAGRPEQAIDDLRTALEYAPDDHPSHLLLAEALAQGHHTEEATNYFLTLGEAEPADGFINLQLARLYRSKGDSSRAIDSYRVATLGNWNRDGVAQRLQAQLELSEYLLQLGQTVAAHTELMMAAANAPDSPSANLRLGDEFLAANAPNEALNSYAKAVTLAPDNLTALMKAAAQAYALDRYAEAAHFAETAFTKKPNKQQTEAISLIAHQSERLLQLSMGGDLPPQTRSEHIQVSAAIATQRLRQCSTTFDPASIPPPLQELKTEWQQAKAAPSHKAGGNVLDPDQTVQLIFDTEIKTSQTCSEPTGDDALLLRLAKTAQRGQQETQQ
jgi:tetratricopeptide (TPR) repeat protein